MDTFDVAVVGAGIVGATAAHACASRGARVVLLERGGPAGEASGAAAGMLAPCSEAHGPGPFLDLARRSLAMWPALAQQLETDSGVGCDLHLDGLLRVALDATSWEAVQARAGWQQDAGVDCVLLDAAAAAADEPALAACMGAALYAGEGHVDSAQAVAAAVAGLRRRGGDVLTRAEVVGPAPGGGVRLRDGRSVTAGAVVLAGGAWLGDLVGAFGGPPIGMTPVRGQLLALRGIDPLPRRVLFAGLQGYAVARDDGTVLVGATEEEAGFDRRATAAAEERLRANAGGLLRGAAGAVVAGSWAGLRPRSADGLPVVGLLDDASAPVPLVVAGGHYRNGVLLAPVTADAVAAAVLDGLLPDGWDAFSPARFS